MSESSHREQSADAYCTTGSSPGVRAAHVARRLPHADDATSPLPSVHLLGPGAVGSALLRQFPPGFILTGVTDTTGTVRGRGGLDPRWIATSKARGRPVASQPGARTLAVADALTWVDADVVIDATATDYGRQAWADALERCVLQRGRALVLAAKDALCLYAARWLAGAHAGRVGCNAVLGGTGGRLVRELDELHASATAIAIAGNASTTAIIEALEAGGDVSDGIAHAAASGLLEADPELDLRGTDAAAKLAIVAGAVFGRGPSPSAIPCDDVRTLDPAAVRARALRGRTTRLVARADARGVLAVRFEEVPRGSLLATPIDRVVYAYALEDGGVRLHEGRGLGAEATAHAAIADVDALRKVATQAALAVGGVR